MEKGFSSQTRRTSVLLITTQESDTKSLYLIWNHPKQMVTQGDRKGLEPLRGLLRDGDLHSANASPRRPFLHINGIKNLCVSDISMAPLEETRS